MMRDLAGTAVLIVSIAMIVVVMFMAPKGFQLSPQNPLPTASEISAGDVSVP